MYKKALVGPLIGILIAIIVALAVVIPVTITTINATNLTGYETTLTVVQLFPLLTALLVLVAIAGFLIISK